MNIVGGQGLGTRGPDLGLLGMLRGLLLPGADQDLGPAATTLLLLSALIVIPGTAYIAFSLWTKDLVDLHNGHAGFMGLNLYLEIFNISLVFELMFFVWLVCLVAYVFKDSIN